MTKKIVNYLVMAIVTLTANQMAQGMDLVRDGKPVATVVVATNAPRMVTFAASELQAYVEKVSGAKLPIVNTKPTDGRPCVFVGESAWTKELGLSVADLGLDGFKIMAKDNWLALFGKEDDSGSTTSSFWRINSFNARFGISRFGQTGALYAVYRFLEDQCGIRWYMPGELGEVVPKRGTVSVGILESKKTPDFESRDLLHAFFPKDDDATLWYRRIGFGTPFEMNINHSFYRFNKYKESHPEYYALVDGKRDFNITCNPPGNFCLSEPGVLKQFVADIREYFEKYPDAPIFSVMPNDGFERICECPKCQAQVDASLGEYGKYSDYVWNFVNEVAKEIYKTHPNKLIACCAYAPYQSPPGKIEKFSPNVAVRITATCRPNQITDKDKDLVKEWGKKGVILDSWQYYNWCTQSIILRGLPVFFPHNIAEDIKFLKEQNCRGEFIEAESWRPRSDDVEKMYYPGLTHLNIYLSGRLLWDASLDVDQLLEEYYEKFYGPAKEPMKSFWSLSEKLWMSAALDKSKIKIFETVYTEDKIDQLLAYLNSAVAKTQKGSLERKRVELILSEFAPVKERVKNNRLRTLVRVAAPSVKPPPVIDGILNDACWQKAAKIDFVGQQGEKADYGTDGWMAWDENNLYLAFANEEPNPAGMRRLATARDGITKPCIWDDDSMEIFINTHPVQDKEYYQFIINATGTLWDGKQGSKEFGMDGYKWNSHCEAKAKVSEKQWVVEMKIPFQDLAITNPSGKTFSVNFYRNRFAGTEDAMQYTCWSPTLMQNHHQVDRFGFITFEDAP